MNPDDPLTTTGWAAVKFDIHVAFRTNYTVITSVISDVNVLICYFDFTTKYPQTFPSASDVLYV